MRRIFCTVLVGILVMTACKRQKEDNENRLEADSLFSSSISLARLYIDSLNSSEDSVQASRLFSDFNDRFNDLNYEATPDTDLKLTPGQNDTIYNMLSEIRKIYESKLEKSEVVDTLEVAEGHEKQ